VPTGQAEADDDFFAVPRIESIHLFGFQIRKPTNLPLAYASVLGRTTGWLIRAKGWLVQLPPTGRDETH
jgi:hypothetical protein